MAKLKRTVVGSVLTPKEAGKPSYIKFRQETAKDLAQQLLRTSDKGMTLKLESKKAQLESLDSALSAGKLSPEIGEKIRERIEKIPDFVKFEIVMLSE